MACQPRSRRCRSRGGPSGRSAGSVVAGDEIEHRLGDIGGVIADPLDVLRAEQQMGAERDVARVFHHVGQKVAKHRILERVEFGVALPDRARAFDVALGVGVEHVLHQLGRDFVHVLEADRSRAARAPRAPIFIERLAMFLARSPTRSRSPATRIAPMISRRSTAIGWRRAMVRIACSSISRCSASRRGSVATTCWASVDVGLAQRVHRVDHHFLGDAAHFGDAPLERVEFLVVGFDGVIDHGACSLSRTGR